MPIALLAYGPHGWQLMAYLVVCVVSGISIGTVGPGGVLLTPILGLMEVPVDVAGAAVVTSFTIVGITSIASNWADCKVLAPRIRRLWPSVVPGAVLGAFIFPLLPPLAVRLEVALITLVCGTRILLKDAPCVPAWAWVPGRGKQTTQLLHPDQPRSTSTLTVDDTSRTLDDGARRQEHGAQEGPVAQELPVAVSREKRPMTGPIAIHKSGARRGGGRGGSGGAAAAIAAPPHVCTLLEGAALLGGIATGSS